MGVPVLWHIEFSNYNEKARWALDFKGIAHERRAPPPGLHPLWAWRLARGRTLPVLEFEGRAYGDTTASSPRWSVRNPSRRCTPTIRSSASTRWRSRTTSTRTSATTCGAWRSPQC